ncbi:MAG TPA: hypothetical protein VIY29_01035 [Ktedonobacteraceae bacterium]
MRERSSGSSPALSAEKNPWVTQTVLTRTTTVLKTPGNGPRLRARSAHLMGYLPPIE